MILGSLFKYPLELVRNSSWKSRFVVIGAVAFGFSINLFLGLFSRQVEIKAAKSQLVAADTVPVAVEGVSVKDIKNEYSTHAFLQPWKEAVLRPDAQVTVKEVVVEVGSRVKRGQSLVIVDSELRSLKKQLEAFDSQLRNIDFSVTMELAKRKFVSENEMKQRQIEKRAREIQARISQIESNGRVVAPFDGLIAEVQLKAGDYIDNQSQYYIKIVDPSALKIGIYVTRSIAKLLEKNSKVTLRMRGATTESDSSIQKEAQETIAKISAISPVVDSRTGSVYVELALTSPPPGWAPGQLVEVRLPLQTSPQALVVPLQAVVNQKDQTYLFRVKTPTERGPSAETGQPAGLTIVEKIPVKVGLRDAGYIEVIEGVEELDQIVTEGQGLLSDGAKVEIVK